MELTKIRRGTPEERAFVRINEEAFPEAERAPSARLLDMAEHGQIDLTAAVWDGTPAGFFAAMRFEEMVYLMFLAIAEEWRGRGLGSAVLEAMGNFYEGKRLILDLESTEIPSGNREQRIRRKRFYLDNGFSETGYRMQYAGETFEVLCSDGEFSEPRFRELLKHIPARNFRPRLYNREEGGDR